MPPGPPDRAAPSPRARSVERADRVKRLALEAGFDLAGVARATPLDPAPLDAWLARGRHADMSWMHRGRDARVEPDRLLPGARSVLSLAVNYWTPGDTALPGGGRLSRYAWGRDYHKVLGGALKRLRASLGEAFPDVRTWGGTDAVPIMEKVWAQRAGLGWVGKSGNLITRRYGTWVFLATLLTDLELAPDPPHPDQCGRCTACLSACPTGAIVAPREVDAGRCLSYHTIEHDRPWPEDVARRSEGWIFGCDVCQDVCPFSRTATVESARPDFAARGGDAPPSLIALLETALSPAAWDAFTRGSPLRRPGRAGLARNVCVALGRAGSPKAVPVLVKAMGDPEPLVRLYAVWALARLPAPSARTELEGLAARETHPWVVAELERALEALHT